MIHVLLRTAGVCAIPSISATCFYPWPYGGQHAHRTMHSWERINGATAAEKKSKWPAEECETEAVRTRHFVPIPIHSNVSHSLMSKFDPDGCRSRLIHTLGVRHSNRMASLAAVELTIFRLFIISLFAGGVWVKLFNLIFTSVSWEIEAGKRYRQHYFSSLCHFACPQCHLLLSSSALLIVATFLVIFVFFFLLFDCVEYSVAAKWGNIISLRLTTEKVSLLRNSSLFFHSFFFYFYFNVVVAFGCVRYLLSLLEWQRNKAQQQQNSRADKPSSTLCVKNYLENLGMFGGFNDAAGPSMCRGLAIACYCSDVVPLERMKQVDKKKKKKTNNNEENDQSFIFVRNYAKRDMPKCESALPETNRTICLGVPWLFTLAWSRTKADGWAASP